MYNRIIRGVAINVENPFKVDSTVIPKQGKGKNSREGLTSESGDLESDKSPEEQMLDLARNEVELMLDEARAEAERILEFAKKEAQQTKEEAYNLGYEEGYFIGLNEAKESYRRKIVEAEEIHASAEREYHDVMQSMEGDIVFLAISIARKVVEYEISINPEIIVTLIKNALRKTSGRKGIKLEVSKEDFESVVLGLNTSIKREIGISDVEAKENAALSQGDFEIETHMGTINGLIEKKFDKITTVFEEINNGHDSEEDV